MHHAQQPDPEMTDRMRERFEELKELQSGATGRFPEGKLTEADEGEIRFQIGYQSGKVVMDFGQPTAWIGMSPQQAKELAHMLNKWANPVTRPKKRRPLPL